MNHNQARPRVVEGFMKEKVVLQYIPNLGKTAVLPVLLMAAPPTITRQSFFSCFSCEQELLGWPTQSNPKSIESKPER